jgi:hypothetical protein
MQVLQAGERKLVLLELDTETVENILKQAGVQHRINDSPRSMSIDVLATDRTSPLLLFDASDPGNIGWFSRCQFYVDGTSGTVLQTPIALSNLKDSNGKALPHSVHLQIAKELPATFRLPGKQPVNEQMVYAVLFNFLNALLNTGVGLCGRSVIQPLAGRTEARLAGGSPGGALKA